MAFLYRGAGSEELAAELATGAVEGQRHDIYNGNLQSNREKDYEGELLSSLDWAGGRTPRRTTVGVTGGVTDSLVQTKRFSDGENYAMVLDGSVLPFRKIEYDYEWFDRHPGALNHVLTTADGEIRLTGRRGAPGKLFGTVDERRVKGEKGLRVEHWGTGSDLPATSPRSLFAEEDEYVAFRDGVSIRGAVEGVVSFQDPLSIRVAYAQGRDMKPKEVDFEEALPEVYEMLRDPLPPWATFYLLVADVDDSNPSGGWDPDSIKAAYRDDGRVPPENVPPRFRGVGR